MLNSPPLKKIRDVNILVLKKKTCNFKLKMKNWIPSVETVGRIPYRNMEKRRFYDGFNPVAELIDSGSFTQNKTFNLHLFASLKKIIFFFFRYTEVTP